MLPKRILTIFVLAGVMLAICGCRPSLVGPDAGAYSTGKLYAVTARDMNAVYQATLKALDHLEIEVTETAKDFFYARVVAKGADNKTITIRIKPGEGENANFTIKIGTFGDKHRSQVIYEQIRQNLGINTEK
ncbi:MAG: DUF3568 family protein [Planctomycetota bacterium]|jgi:hypothetical protein